MAAKEAMVQRVVRRDDTLSSDVVDARVKGDQPKFIKACQRVVNAAKLYESYLNPEVFHNDEVPFAVKLEKLSTRQLQDLANELSHLAPI